MLIKYLFFLFAIILSWGDGGGREYGGGVGWEWMEIILIDQIIEFWKSFTKSKI